MHGRAGLKPAIPARNMPRPLLKLSSLNASTTSKLTPFPPSRSAPFFEGVLDTITWLDVAIFNEAKSRVGISFWILAINRGTSFVNVSLYSKGWTIKGGL